MVRGAVLLKTENGQLQVVNIAGASGSPLPGTATYRLQSLPVSFIFNLCICFFLLSFLITHRFLKIIIKTS